MFNWIDLIILIVVIVGLFMLFREILLWYWKINIRVRLLDDILEELRGISKRLDALETKRVSVQEPQDNRERLCAESNGTQEYFTRFCTECGCKLNDSPCFCPVCGVRIDTGIP